MVPIEKAKGNEYEKERFYCLGCVVRTMALKIGRYVTATRLNDSITPQYDGQNEIHLCNSSYIPIMAS